MGPTPWRVEGRNRCTHKHLPDLARPLWSQPLRHIPVRQPRNVLLSLFHHHERQRRDIARDNATPDRLALALARAAGTVARDTFGEEEFDTLGREDALFHGEALLVVAALDAEDVAFEFVAEEVCGDVGRDALVIEDSAGDERSEEKEKG